MWCETKASECTTGIDRETERACMCEKESEISMMERERGGEEKKEKE